MFGKLNNSSRLMMYLAGELAAEDRAQVERMLGADAALRAELQELDGAIGSFDAGMARLDATPLQGESAALTRIGSAMRQRLADRSMSADAPERIGIVRLRRFPAWAYPAAAAAAVLIACLVWFDRPAANTGILVIRGPNPHTSDPISSSGPAEEITHAMTNSFDQGNPAQQPKSVASLEAAEEQIAELTNGGSDPVRSFFAIPDANE
ncbi:MAG TPA: hypothetical protein VG326_02475 [Tepidisphaeraceae bacterium]|nr:hypothetical protein [Tepidisphaeraceae bacterium]